LRRLPAPNLGGTQGLRIHAKRLRIRRRRNRQQPRQQPVRARPIDFTTPPMLHPWSDASGTKTRSVKGDQGRSRGIKGDQGGSREIEGAQGGSREIEGDQGGSREIERDQGQSVSRTGGAAAELVKPTGQIYRHSPFRDGSSGVGLDPAGLDPAGLDPAGLDPAGLDPAGPHCRRTYRRPSGWSEAEGSPS
jgi:hypothetical protein